MVIHMKKTEHELTLTMEGKLDSQATVQLEALLRENLAGVTLLIFDMEQVKLLTSAGLRILLAAHRRMNRTGRLVLRHVSEEVVEILRMTCFLDILHLEQGSGSA